MRSLQPTLAAFAAVAALASCGLPPASGAQDGAQDGAQPVAVPRGDAEVAAALAGAFEGSPVPGGVAAIARLGEAPRIGSFGVRKAGDDAPFLPGDLVHIGSCTKAMTAALLARLDSNGRLDWSASLRESLPDLAEAADPAFAGVTLRHLLTHTSGLPANALVWWAHADLPLRERRLAIASAMMRRAPDEAPGASFEYSNLGYMVAGCVAEAAADATWEELLLAEVAEPLGMASLGFGPPSVDGAVDQPWGHSLRDGEARPSQRDNAEALGPAGRVHLSMADWSRFVLAFTDGAIASEGAFLSEEERARLLEPARDDYACGWMVTERGWGGGEVLWHNGSNTYWYAVTWVAPRRDRAFLVAVNAAGEGVRDRADRAVAALIRADAARDEREDSAK